MNDQFEYIPVDKIRPNPFQPRTSFDKEKLEELAGSIKEKGLIEPIVVRKKGETYEIIVGERRWRACQFAELHKIPAIIKEVDDLEAREISLVENWHRLNLNTIETEEFIYKLWREGKEKGRYNSINDMSKKIGIPFTTLKDLIYAYEERKEISAGTKLTYTDFRAARPVRDDKEIWKELLKKREEERIRRDDLQKTAQILKQSPKIKEAIKEGYVVLDDVIKVSTKNLEPEEVERKIIEKKPEIITEIDTSVEIICPVCNKKLKLIHKEPEGHKVKEIMEE